MISGIIFTKNRALQLDLLLQSIEKNGNGIFDVTVLYRHTSEEFKKGYEKVKSRFPDVNWVEESDFQKDCFDILQKASELVSFFVDDNILYSPMKASYDQIKSFLEPRDVYCLSLRLGANTIIQNYHTGTLCILPQQGSIVDKTFFVWNWKSLPPFTNFSYPFSVDGHIFNKEDVLKVISQYDFDTPNAFEGNATRFLPEEIPVEMSSFKKSVLVNTPLNLVGSSENAAGKDFGVSIEDFNAKYLDGYIPSLEDMDFSEIRGCHQELEIKLTKECNV